MKLKFLIVSIFICSTQIVCSQSDDGVVSFDIPVRNSLMFNRSLINPTFSFVREQNKSLSLYNKREWTQFEDAPLTYLASYSGRFAENIGAGVSVFQQNFGVLTTFGGIVNFAYNAQLNRDNNLTFGLNIGAYSSGINEGSVVTNFPDPSLQNIPSNFVLSVNPGINYGTTFLDVGVSINNLLLYNFSSSELLQDDPNQGIQAHVMYTGYMSSRGFFDDSKFTALLRSEFTEDETIISGNAMVYVPKGLWFQAGYNTRYGASAGIGLNITKEIALEYNFETAFGDLLDFGPSHEITFAYRFKNQRYFDYSRQDEVSGLINSNKKPKRRIVKAVASKPKVATPKKAEKVETDLAKAEEEQKQLEAEKLAKEEAIAKQFLKEKQQKEAERLALIEQKRLEEAKIEADKQAKALEEQKQRKAAAEEKRLEQQKLERIKAEEERIAKVKAEQFKKEQDAKDRLAKIEAEKLEKAQQEAEAKRIEKEQLAEEKTKKDLINNPTDALGKQLKSITDAIEGNKQEDLLERYNKAIEGKNENLINLKEENDLSEQGIAIKPKEFKSVTKQNNELKAVKSELDNAIAQRNKRIRKLEELYETITLDEVSLYYKKKIEDLKTEQKNANDIKLNLEKRLEDIQIGIEFEKRRRIKRAEFDNEEERHNQDRAALANLKRTINLKEIPPVTEDYDFGIPQDDNIKILKNINYVQSGYYTILAVHSDMKKRDDFITKTLESGLSTVEFFYDVNTSRYYIYSNKLNSIQEANSTLKQRGTKPYNSKMTIIKIEN